MLFCNNINFNFQVINHQLDIKNQNAVVFHSSKWMEILRCCILESFIDSMNDMQITAKLGSKVPVITNVPSGIIGRDVFSDEFKEVYSVFYLHNLIFLSKIDYQMSS